MMPAVAIQPVSWTFTLLICTYADEMNTPYDSACVGTTLMPDTLTDALTIANAASATAGGDTTGVRPEAGSAKIATEETLSVKFWTVTCSGYVSPSSMTTHDIPAGGV